jgi:hypothetical protein
MNLSRDIDPMKRGVASMLCLDNGIDVVLQKRSAQKHGAPDFCSVKLWALLFVSDFGTAITRQNTIIVQTRGNARIAGAQPHMPIIARNFARGLL